MNALKSRVEPQPVSPPRLRASPRPCLPKGVSCSPTLDEGTPRVGRAPRAGAAAHAKRALDEVEQQRRPQHARRALPALPLGEPLRLPLRQHPQHLRAHGARGPREDPLGSGQLDWREYFLNVHLPGLEKWVFPGLEEERKRRRQSPPTAICWSCSTPPCTPSATGWRSACRGEKEERFTYGQVHRYARRVGSFLLERACSAGAGAAALREPPRVGHRLLRHPRPAACVPVDTGITQAEVVNIAARRAPRGAPLGRRRARLRRPARRCYRRACSPRCTASRRPWRRPAFPDRIGNVRKSAAPDEVASLIFTSGTTGKPKGVMLNDRDFTSPGLEALGRLRARRARRPALGAAAAPHLRVHRGLPGAARRGAEIAYLDEMNADPLGEVFEHRPHHRDGGRARALAAPAPRSRSWPRQRPLKRP